MALPLYRRACDHFETLLQADKLPDQNVNHLALFYYQIGLAYDLEKQDDEALAAYQRGAELFRRSLDPQSESTRPRITLAACHVYVGDLQRKRGELDKAIESHQQAITIFEELLNKNPGDRTIDQRLRKSREKVWEMKNPFQSTPSQPPAENSLPAGSPQSND